MTKFHFEISFAQTWLHSKTHIECDISKNWTRLWQPISAHERLCCMTYRKIRLEKYAQKERVRSREFYERNAGCMCPACRASTPGCTSYAACMHASVVWTRLKSQSLAATITQCVLAAQQFIFSSRTLQSTYSLTRVTHSRQLWREIVDSFQSFVSRQKTINNLYYLLLTGTGVWHGKIPIM